MFTIAPIVEGHGDVSAIRVLLQKLVPTIHVARPVRFPKSRLINNDSELARAVAIASANIRDSQTGLILLTIDADNDCAARLGPDLLRKMLPAANGAECFVAIAVHEFESWIVGGHPDINVVDPENSGKPKDRIAKVNDGLYQETADQPRFTAAIDPQLLRTRSPSFQRLINRLEALGQHIP